jgi:hypothetical protein
MQGVVGNMEGDIDFLFQTTVQSTQQCTATSQPNTILYDIAFLTQNLDPETGEPDGTMKEYEPEMGSVSIKITFLKNQLEKELGAVTAEDLQVIHLPLTQEVRESVPTTMDATQITADDILIEEVLSESAENPDEGLAIGRAWFQAPEVDGSVVVRYDRSSENECNAIKSGRLVRVKIVSSGDVDLNGDFVSDSPLNQGIKTSNSISFAQEM